MIPEHVWVPLALAAEELRAAGLDIPLRTLRRYCEQENIRGMKVGKLWRIPRSELDRIKQEGITLEGNPT